MAQLWGLMLAKLINRSRILFFFGTEDLGW
jgi:hypothetical protein